MINKTPKDYRKDIDGLRAIAVLSVIIHHLDKNFIINTLYWWLSGLKTIMCIFT